MHHKWLVSVLVQYKLIVDLTVTVPHKLEEESSSVGTEPRVAPVLQCVCVWCVCVVCVCGGRGIHLRMD